MWFRVELTQSGLYEGRAYKFTASDPDNRLGGGYLCLGFDVSVFHPSSVPPQVNWMCKGQVHSGGGTTITFGECQREVFSPRHGQPAAPRGCSSVYAKGVQLLKNRVVDSVKLCAAYADLKQNHTQLPFLHEIHLYTVKPEGRGRVRERSPMSRMITASRCPDLMGGAGLSMAFHMGDGSLAPCALAYLRDVGPLRADPWPGPPDSKAG